MIVDMREINGKVKPIHYGLPRLDTVVHHLKGADCFAKADNTNGYSQVLLEEDSRKYTAFDSPAGALEHCVMPQGFRNSGPWYQKDMEGVLRELLWRALLQYLDDSLLYAKGEANLKPVLEKYFDLLDQHNIKLHPDKLVLFTRTLVWCGKQLSKNGIKPAPHRVETALNMAEPVTLADMMSYYVYGVAWFRNHIVNFAKISAPLYDLWRDGLAPYKRKTMAMAKHFVLADMPAWKEKGRDAFERVKRALATAIETSYFDPEKKTCVFGDANPEFWCLMLTQCAPGVERQP